MPLPRVTPEIGHAVKAELERTPGNQYVVSLLERLEKVNPCVAEFVSQMALRHQDPVMVSTAALLVYRLLESQSEADEMKAQFKPGS
ncbi:MAG: hypothetical protein L0216_05335 [Planctomycetales bacterium]|nr:hypothetical protein [Planctomycetales bacterium]